MGNQLTVDGFARVVCGRHGPGDIAPHVAALNRVARLAEAERFQQLVHQASRVGTCPLVVLGRAVREGVAGERGHDDVVRELVWAGVLLLEELEHGQEFEEASGPAVEEGDGDGGGVGGKEGDEVDGVGAAVVVLYGESEVGEGVDVSFSGAPGEVYVN